MDTFKKNIINHFKKLKIKKNDHILVYSKLSSFGIIDRHFSKKFLNILIEYIGSKGTIIMPSYTFESKDYIFNIKTLKHNYSSSLLVKEFFKIKKTRSKRLIHSHIALGLKADILKRQINPTITLGRNSDFDIMTKNNFKCVFLGCDANAAGTFFIHLEYLNNVPYRKNIILEKKISHGKKNKIIKVKYSSRPKMIDFDFNLAFKKIEKLGAKINKVELKYGFSYSLSLKDFLNFENIMLKKNKNALIKKKK